MWKIYKGSVVQDIFEKPGTKGLIMLQIPTIVPFRN